MGFHGGDHPLLLYLLKYAACICKSYNGQFVDLGKKCLLHDNVRMKS